MCLHPHKRAAIPPDTAALGQKLLDEHNPYRMVGDRLTDLVRDEDFADLYTPIGGPAISPAILSLVTVFQMMEKLPDRAAVEAVRVRIDWKYALHLSLDDPGFVATNLSHFRTRLLAHEAEYRSFDALVQKLVGLGFIRRRGKQRTDSTHILGLVAKLSRLELIWETLRVALGGLKQADEGWLKQHLPEALVQEYLVKHSGYRLSAAETAAALRQAGADGWWLLQQLEHAPAAVQALAEIHTLRTVWEQQYEVDEGGEYRGPRQKLSGGGLIESPHETEVRYGEKRGQTWQGYKAQVSETAEAKGDPNFITDMGVTDAQLSDHPALPPIQQRLEERGVPPSETYVDQAYVSTTQLAQSTQRGIRLMGPLPEMPPSPKFPIGDFEIDWEQHLALCPAAKVSTHCSLAERPDGAREYWFYFGSQCVSCPLRERCTSARDGRTLTIHEHHAYLVARQAEMQTEAFWEAMKRRPPIEGTISQLVRQGLRRARYRGLRKVNLQAIFLAIAVNLKRLIHCWATGREPSWAV